MMLLTKENIAALPPLRSQDGKDARQVPIVVKFFTPDSSWTWYATEGEKIPCEVCNGSGRNPLSDNLNWLPCSACKGSGAEDWQFFGLVVGMETELGYWSLAELAAARGPLGLPIERDRHFHGKSLYDVLVAHGEPDLAAALGPDREATPEG